MQQLPTPKILERFLYPNQRAQINEGQFYRALLYFTVFDLLAKHNKAAKREKWPEVCRRVAREIDGTA